MTKGEQLIQDILNQRQNPTKVQQEQQTAPERNGPSNRYTITKQEKPEDYQKDSNKAKIVKGVAIAGALALAFFTKGIFSDLAFIGLGWAAIARSAKAIYNTIKAKSNSPQIEQEDSVKRR